MAEWDEVPEWWKGDKRSWLYWAPKGVTSWPPPNDDDLDEQWDMPLDELMGRYPVRASPTLRDAYRAASRPPAAGFWYDWGKPIAREAYERRTARQAAGVPQPSRKGSKKREKEDRAAWQSDLDDA